MLLDIKLYHILTNISTQTLFLSCILYIRVWVSKNKTDWYSTSLIHILISNSVTSLSLLHAPFSASYPIVIYQALHRNYSFKQMPLNGVVMRDYTLFISRSDIISLCCITLVMRSLNIIIMRNGFNFTIVFLLTTSSTGGFLKLKRQKLTPPNILGGVN